MPQPNGPTSAFYQHGLWHLPVCWPRSFSSARHFLSLRVRQSVWMGLASSPLRSLMTIVRLKAYRSNLQFHMCTPKLGLPRCLLNTFSGLLDRCFSRHHCLLVLG